MAIKSKDVPGLDSWSKKQLNHFLDTWWEKSPTSYHAFHAHAKGKSKEMIRILFTISRPTFTNLIKESN